MPGNQRNRKKSVTSEVCGGLWVVQQQRSARGSEKMLRKLWWLQHHSEREKTREQTFRGTIDGNFLAGCQFGAFLWHFLLLPVRFDRKYAGWWDAHLEPWNRMRFFLICESLVRQRWIFTRKKYQMVELQTNDLHLFEFCETHGLLTEIKVSVAQLVIYHCEERFFLRISSFYTVYWFIEVNSYI